MREPGWWYRDRPTALARMLEPAARVWSYAAERRLVQARPWRSRLPVICVGNFTAGGTGKTPLAGRICADLVRMERQPFVLSRGHGGWIAGPHWVDPVADTAREVGDEPLLHAARVPVAVSRDRVAGARLIEARAGADGVIVMDDGLQNFALAKDLAIAVVDGRRGLGNGRVMPSGPLRAPLPFQLALADAIVVNVPAGSAAGPNAVAAGLRQSFAGPVLTAVTRPAAPLNWLKGLSVVAWAGIGNPGRFFDLLAGAGAELVGQVTFPDHHLPSERAAERLIEAAERRGAILVTTEKDLARLAGGGPAATALRVASRALAIAIELTPRDAMRLDGLLAAALSSAAPAPDGA